MIPEQPTNKRRARLLGVVVGVVSMWSSAANADTESVSFGVNAYGSSGYCPGVALTHSIDDAQTFMAATRDQQGYDAYYVWTGLGADWEDFVEGSGDETSPSGTDWADVVFFSGHGAAAVCPGGGAPKFGKIVAGEPGPANVCEIRVGGSTSNVSLAAGGVNSDTNFLMLLSSRTLEFCAANYGNINYWVDAGNSGTQQTLINGFHNSPLDEDHNDLEVFDYVANAGTEGIGDDWVDLLSSRGGFNSDCAVSSVVGYNTITNDSLYFYGGFNDWHDTGVHQSHWYYADCGHSYCSTIPGC